jgi:hypothetical protein
LELVTVCNGIPSTTRARGDGPALDHRYFPIFAVVEADAASRAESWFSCVAILDAWNVLAEFVWNVDAESCGLFDKPRCAPLLDALEHVVSHLTLESVRVSDAILLRGFGEFCSRDPFAEYVGRAIRLHRFPFDVDAVVAPAPDRTLFYRFRNA